MKHKPRLVLAEDEPSLCQFLGELLAGEYAVELALDGQQAWEAIQQQRPEVVLSNVHMPVLDGLALVLKVRNSTATATVPVLLLSAALAEPMSRAAMANAWLQKPFCPRELMDKLRQFSAGDRL